MSPPQFGPPELIRSLWPRCWNHACQNLLSSLDPTQVYVCGAWLNLGWRFFWNLANGELWTDGLPPHMGDIMNYTQFIWKYVKQVSIFFSNSWCMSVKANWHARNKHLLVWKCPKVLASHKFDCMIFFQNWNLDNSTSFPDITMKQSPFSRILKDLSNDTKYIAVWPIRR